MKKIIITLALVLFSQTLVFAQAETKKSSTDIRKSAKSGICYNADSKSYKKLKDFTTYKTVDECVADGGKLPKASTPKKTAAPKKTS
jgi:hypothetical protein